MNNRVNKQIIPLAVAVTSLLFAGLACALSSGQPMLMDRVQVIKGWVDAKGETHERIYDIAVSDGREIGADGRARKPVGNTVNINKATYTNSIGAAILAGYWQDPEFDSDQHAFYYVRVLEIPTPRWTTYDAAFYKIPLPDTVPPTVQDRAYTSPIWYTPGT
jgi:hypothetical protein